MISFPDVLRVIIIPVIKDSSQGRLLGSALVIFHLKDSHVREEKEKKKKKTNRLSEAYPTQHCYNLRASRPRIRVQIPRQAKA